MTGQPDSSFNPYTATQSSGRNLRADDSRSIPTFSKVVFIIDLIMCALRAPMVPLAFLGYVQMKQDGDPMLPTVPFEIGTGAVIVVCGVLGSSLLLARQTWALPLGYLTIVGAVGSIGVGVWQLTLTVDAYPPGSPERIGFFIGAGLFTSLRIALIVLLWIALAKYAAWARRNTSLPPAAM